MRVRGIVLLSAVATAALVVPALAATRTVTIGDNYFVRKSGTPTVTIRKGTTLRWVWRGRRPHNVTVKSGPARFHSPTKTRGSYSRRLTRTGTYRIICTVHGARDQSMVARVR